MSDERPAKPVDNLALRVLQRYYAELCQALRSDPHQMAHEMYSKELISHESMSRAVDTLGITPLDKAGVLVQAIAGRIATANSSEPLMAFCILLERHPGAGSIAARMKARLAYVERHHQLPANEWSSDTEYEQRPSSPGQQDQPHARLENLPPAMQRHSHYLKDIYKVREGMHLKWPRVLMKDYVNLFCVKKEENGDDQKLIEQLVRGNIGKVQKARMLVALSDLARMKDGSRPQCVLVQGAPGSGKTMFSWEVSRKWAQGELLQQYPLVVMLPLRDPDVQNASSIEDLFPHDHKPFQQEVAIAVKQKSGKGVLLLLDGFDELPDGKRKGSSLWMRLITGKLLPLATVMVTSRPWAIKTLLEPDNSPRISQHIEIVGFTTENTNEYISKAFPDVAKESNFCKYLASYPHIRSTMYVPLNCAIVVEVYRSSGSTYPAPKTMTQLYTALVRALLLRYAKSHPNGPSLGIADRLASRFRWQSRIHVFEGLPSNVYQQLCKISRLAYKGLCNNLQLIFSDLPSDFETLGLLQSVPQVYDTGEMSVSYNFLHLTVQEFLAAFHILLQGPRKQQEILSGEVAFRVFTMEEEVYASNFGEDEGGDEPSTKSGDVVRMFVAGLTGLKKSKLAVPKVIEQEDMAVLRLLFESQNESLTSSVLRNEANVHAVHTPASPHDMYVLGYCISLSSCRWELNIFGTGDEHMEMMRIAITSWGGGNGRIMNACFFLGHLTSDGLGHLLSLPQHTLGDLNELNLFENKLDSKSCDMLAHHLPFLPHLQVLDLRMNSIDAGDYMPLIRAILTAGSLQEVLCESLSPGECQLLMSQECVSRLALWKLSMDSVEAMTAALNNHDSLECLDVMFSSFSHQNMSTFSSSIATNSTLQVLHLTECNIDCECAELLSQSLHTNTTLRELDLSQNGIKDRGGRSLAKALRVNKYLEVLCLDYNPLGEESIRQLMDSFRHSPSLVKITLPD